MLLVLVIGRHRLAHVGGHQPFHPGLGRGLQGRQPFLGGDMAGGEYGVVLLDQGDDFVYFREQFAA